MEECIFGKFSPSRLKRKKEEKKEDEDVRVAPHLSNQTDLNLVFITVQAAETGRFQQKKKKSFVRHGSVRVYATVQAEK